MSPTCPRCRSKLEAHVITLTSGPPSVEGSIVECVTFDRAVSTVTGRAPRGWYTDEDLRQLWTDVYGVTFDLVPTAPAVQDSLL